MFYGNVYAILVDNFHKKSELCSDPHHGEIQSQHHEMSDESLKTILVVLQKCIFIVVHTTYASLRTLVVIINIESFCQIRHNIIPFCDM